MKLLAIQSLQLLELQRHYLLVLLQFWQDFFLLSYLHLSKKMLQILILFSDFHNPLQLFHQGLQNSPQVLRLQLLYLLLSLCLISEVAED